MAESIDKDESHAPEEETEPATVQAADAGHRHGNFHNYYAFHPTANRMDTMKPIFDHLAAQNPPSKRRKSDDGDTIPFSYCDLGCNEGDLTIAISKALQMALRRKVRFEGIDLDPLLVDRANQKWKDTAEISGSFRDANICDAMKFLESFDMISLLSTSMWVHVHAGDDGLKELLCEMCSKAKTYIVIEPQPSKW